MCAKLSHATVFETRHVGESVAGAARGAITRSSEEAAVIRSIFPLTPQKNPNINTYFLCRIRAEQEAARIAEGIRGVYGVIEERMQVNNVKNYLKQPAGR